MVYEMGQGRPTQGLIPVANPPPIRILYVEDDPHYREAITTELSENGFLVRSFADAAALAEAADAVVDADIIVLDWALPKISGIDLLTDLRQSGVDLPVVFLTGNGFSAAEVMAFDRGAVDFIDKARGAEILVRRLRLLVRAPNPAAAPAPATLVVCSKLVLHPDVGRAHWNGRDVGLTLGEFNIVHRLASNAGGWVTYREVYDSLHYEGFVGGQGEDGYRINVRGIVRRIRKKFRRCDETFAEIENRAGLGYRWGNSAGASQ
jgi:two-component system response regulator ChvI